ncbi:hypothetical protein [Bacillus thuringiensis]|uniref:hypothetical protein n=1 Tax=Bacillus thuringiensis TaxID=1428 RepID=UPI000BF2A405|nr:hypothetical protein [Bacillus thuringiensis]PFL06512.1 hypothetical protein COJ28_17875 [Bacillus thuringiensis]PGU47385.1 hypothetical protein COD63_00480 [Bacillus thuringiensis]
MTAEIALLNKFGVALAADSAVSIENGNGVKVYNSANKLFSLSKFTPVGIMVFGDSSFMNVPWETLIKVYRKRLGNTTYPDLMGYCKDFISFLISQKECLSITAEEILMSRLTSLHLNSVFEKTNMRMEEVFKNKVPNSEERIEALKKELLQHIKIINREKNLTNMPQYTKEDFLSRFSESILETGQYLINIHELDNDLENLLLDLMFLVSFKNLYNYTTNYSGVVITGFGENNLFPSIYSYRTDGVIMGQLRYELYDEDHIGNEVNNASALIKPFAQQEMVHSFVEGINSDLKEILTTSLQKIFKESFPEMILTSMENLSSDISTQLEHSLKVSGQNVLESFENTLEELISDTYSGPLMRNLANLHKEELASLAKALVNLTSLKRKVTSDAETVGGPIDVAVISKGDGFIWIDRKHYFNSQLNYSFFNKYLMDGDSNVFNTK